MSLVISADSQRLSWIGGTPLWTSATEFTIAIWGKVTTAQWGDMFGITDNGDESYNNAIIRTASGTSFDHSIVLQATDSRLDSAGSIAANTWTLSVLTYKQGVARIGYVNGSVGRTDATGVSNSWVGGQGLDTIYIGNVPFAYGTHNGRFKLAHAAIWNKALSSTEVGQLYNGGAGGAGMNPQDVAAANLKFYDPLNADATVVVGGITLSATGSPTFDSADNPNVAAYTGGGSGTSVSVTGQAFSYSSGSLSVSASRSVALTGQAYSYAQGSPSVVLPSGVINIPPVFDWGTNTVKLSASYQADIYNRTTRALIVSKTGLTTHATTGAGSLSDPALIRGSVCRVVTEFADGSLGVWDYTVE